MKLKLYSCLLALLGLMHTVVLAGNYDLVYHQINIDASIDKPSEIEDLISRKLGIPLHIVATDSQSTTWSDHVQFKLLIFGTVVRHGMVKWNRFRTDNRATLSFPIITSETEVDHSEPLSLSHSRFIKGLIANATSLHSEIQWVMDGGILVKRWVVVHESADSYSEYILDPGGMPALETDLLLHNGPDTTVWVNVYNPDPLTMAEVAYGAPYNDNDDASSQALIDAMKKDSISLRWNENEGRWKLESDFAVAFDTLPPNIAPPAFSTFTQDSLLVNRSHPYFEYFNVYYHIHKAQYLFRHLGFNSLVNYPLHFDAHGSYADQSTFVNSSFKTFLKFGIGGVDDGEDADVIVHEYGHAAIRSASPGSNYGAERTALEEGMCDYLALSYSRRLSDFNRSSIFDWDGHNEFWDGRILYRYRTYPGDLVNDLYNDGLLWTSALGEIADSISLDVADRLALHSMFSWFPYMTMSDAARLFMQSDTLIYDGDHSEIASIILCKRGLLPGCADTLINTLPLVDPYLGNSFDFAYNNAPLYIYQNGKDIIGIDVFDTGGNLLISRDVEVSDKRYLMLEGNQLAQGIYLMVVRTTEGDYPFKIVRLWL